MKGYWRRPDAKAEIIDGDGWFRTGDMGGVDEDVRAFVKERVGACKYPRLVARRRAIAVPDSVASATGGTLEDACVSRRHPFLVMVCHRTGRPRFGSRSGATWP